METKEKDNMIMGFGIATFCIVLGLLMLFMIGNWSKYIGIPLFWFGFLGLSLELSKTKFKSYSSVTLGAPNLITAFYFAEVTFIFILFIAISMAVFVTGLIKFFNSYESEKVGTSKDSKKEITVGVLNFIGSICSILGFIFLFI